MRINNGILSDYTGLRIAIIPQGRKRRPQIVSKHSTLTIHNTGCANVPADNFKRSCHDIAQDKEVSFHFVVDEREVIQLLPINEVAWHAGNKEGNYTSIAIEICERVGAEEHAVKFIAELLHTLGWTTNHIRTHKSWSGKNCPHLILTHWNQFIESIRKLYYQQNNPQNVDKIRIKLNGVIKEVEAINKDGFNYVKLRDLQDDKVEIFYDKVSAMPVVNVRK